MPQKCRESQERKETHIYKIIVVNKIKVNKSLSLLLHVAFLIKTPPQISICVRIPPKKKNYELNTHAYVCV